MQNIRAVLSKCLLFISLTHTHAYQIRYWKGAALYAGREVLLGILSGCVLPGSLNPEPISDQNMPFSIRLYALVVYLKTIPDSRP